MNFNNIIFGTVVFIALYLAYSVGEKQGLRSAPEYVAYERQKDLARDQEEAEWLAEYEGSYEQVCDQVFELVWDYKVETYQAPDLDRADDY